MSYRQDKLILLLESGTSSQVRRTAAKQLAELALKTYKASVTPSSDINHDKQEQDTKEDVKEGVLEEGLNGASDIAGPSTVTLSGKVDEDDAWNEALETISKLLPLLKSKSSDTRHAASHTLGLLAECLPSYPSTSQPVASSSTLPPLDLESLLKSGETLLASAGREYVAKIPGNAADRAKRRKAMMGSLGLGDAVGWGDDVDKVIGDEDEEMPDDGGRTTSGGEASKTPQPTPKDIFEGLSARQITMVKRKKGNMMEEANKLRRLNQAGSNSTPASSGHNSNTNTPPTSSPQKDLSALPSDSNIVTIDPGAKARAKATNGGAVEVSLDNLDEDGNSLTSSKLLPILSLSPGTNPWVTVLSTIQPNLLDPSWQTRHGTALAVMEMLRFIGSDLPSSLLINLSRILLHLLALDRFGDFVGDTVMAPVRETAAQALGVLLKYLDIATIGEVHEVLMGMIRQPWAKRGKEANGLSKGEKFAWEVRHAGLLGMKYMVAVRSDLLGSPSIAIDGVKDETVEIEGAVKVEIKDEIEIKGEGFTLDILFDVVQAAVLALGDIDDDVRTVAASALLPMTSTLASALPQEDLSKLLTTLWGCLEGGIDDLGSSTGAVMDLLCTMLSHDRVMDLITNNTHFFARIYDFIRHPISSVRLSVVQTLHILATDPRLYPRTSWMKDDFLCFLYQNLILEERGDIRDLSLSALSAALEELSKQGSFDRAEALLEDWYGMLMTPIGVPMDESLFYKSAKGRIGHNVDKHLMAGDMSLMTMDSVLERRISAAKALAMFRRYKSKQDLAFIQKYLQSSSAHQSLMASIIIQEWAYDVDRLSSPKDLIVALGSTDPGAEALCQVLVARVESPPPATYHEMSVILRRLHSECQALLNVFAMEGKVSKDKIPYLPNKIDPTSSAKDIFSISTAQAIIGPQFDTLTGQLSKSATKTALPSLQDRRRKIMGSVGYFSVMKERYDVSVSAGIAGALVALRVMPAKMAPVIRAVMESVRREEIEALQGRSSSSVAAFVRYCNSPLFTGKVNPCDKIIRNLFTFLCQDTSITPIFKPESSYDGIISLKESQAQNQPQRKGSGIGKDIPEESEEQISMRITRRGALGTFEALSTTFRSELFEAVPKVWEGISTALLATYPTNPSAEQATTNIDDQLKETPKMGQDLADCLSSLKMMAPSFDTSLYPRLITLFQPIIKACTSSYATIRNVAAKCLSALCSVMTEEGMKMIVDHIVPLIGDAKNAYARRGAVEVVHHIVKDLEVNVLPYILFLIVPILGRMSDPDEAVRLLSTSTFAALVKMVPLEAGLPDPPGFSTELLAKRDEERKFLMQLLDGSKAEQYEIPIPIKADLRQYQREGVSWLAFLAKYQLHGILCDDMGLGKSLQSICIIGSKHHERAARHKTTNSVDSAHLPSLIVCPPTLTGHWFHEILKFTDSLKPLQYVGNAYERANLRSQISKSDIVITSYETVRSDTADLGKIDWLYCVLDEGHIIKNSKTKLSAAVKQLKAQHRLLLSGTPIQNNVLELWSLFDFLMPGFLGSEKVFNDRFSKPILADREGKANPKERDAAAAALESLHKQVLPFLLRRLKEDVLHDLPPKIIQDYYCDLSVVQTALYDEFSKSQAAQEAGEEVATDDSGANSGPTHVFQSLQYLRKLCNHPALVLRGEEKAQKWNQVVKKIGGNVPPMNDISHSPKLEALQQLLIDCGIGLPANEKLGASADDYSQHRVLIFCQLRDMLDLIEKDLFSAHMPSVSYMRMDGSTDPRKRHAIVQKFNDDPRIDVLLLTTSVGGLGLNLTGADTVIFVDHDWNPMKDLQAMDRAHRLGQKKVVNVYRLITKGTLEEKIMGLQRFKLNIASSVVTQQNSGLGSMNTGEVLDLFGVDDGKQQKKQVKSGGPMSASKILEGLEDLPPEDEYSELSLSNFMSKV